MRRKEADGAGERGLIYALGHSGARVQQTRLPALHSHPVMRPGNNPIYAKRGEVK
jgi:hypothetical protein